MPLHFLEGQMTQNLPKSHKVYASWTESHLRPETILWIRLLCCLQSLHIRLLSFPLCSHRTIKCTPWVPIQAVSISRAYTGIATHWELAIQNTGHEAIQCNQSALILQSISYFSITGDWESIELMQKSLPKHSAHKHATYVLDPFNQPHEFRHIDCFAPTPCHQVTQVHTLCPYFLRALGIALGEEYFEPLANLRHNGFVHIEFQLYHCRIHPPVDLTAQLINHKNRNTS